MVLKRRDTWTVKNNILRKREGQEEIKRQKDDREIEERGLYGGHVEKNRGGEMKKDARRKDHII